MATSGDGRWGSIVFRRAPGGWADRLRSYGVSVNGYRVGRLRPGGEVVLPTPPGVHVVRAHIDWTRSPEYGVDVHEGETVVLRVRGSGAILRPDRYLGTRGYLTMERLLEPTRSSPSRDR
ncbi:hypothetical protein AB6N23_05495 [Cellulomonas sp. 179-A 9B4 NHS]|uniref:hypothetical protein n=1 Tax=Cellulomonas sp. 179-A 9B4 NHS TaxID=3142379 RepID=UPI0039A05F6F